MTRPYRCAVARSRPQSALLLPLLAFTLAALPAVPLSASLAAQEPVVVPRLTGQIELDGRVVEAAWEAVPVLPATMQLPTFRGEPTERTEFRVAHDDDFIYFSCRAFDSDPSGIRTPTLQRDDGSFTNDWCVLNLDTFHDRETALVFGTTPAGIRTEAVFANDGASAPNFNWNTFWDAAASRDERGWYAEIRVPLSSLRFQEGHDGRVTMGLAVWRLIARKNEFHTFPAIPPTWGLLSVAKASQFQDVAFQGIEPTRPLYVTPYALAGTGRSYGLDSAGTGYDPVRDQVQDVGLDLKYSLASNLTMDVTINTDFAQVEADDQQVNLTRFSLFFPEKRLFFQERASIFDFSLGGQERLFHSRRVGIVDGEQVPIHAGVRMVGRVGGWDLGVLDMQTAETALAPSENLGVVRVRRRVLNENSYVGGILTSRIAEAGLGTNVVYGADALLRLFGQDYLTLAWSQSFDDDHTADPPTPVRPLERGMARLFWERRGVDGLTYGLEVARAGQAFDPRLGFLRRRDFTRSVGSLSYGWRPGEASPWLTYGPSLDAAVFTRNDNGGIETISLTPQWSAELKSGHVLTATAELLHEDLESGFSLSDDAEIPAGEHRFAVGRLNYQWPRGDLFRINGSVEAGGFYDGRVLAASVTPTWNASRHLELGGSYSVSAITLPERDQRFAAHIARLRSEVMFSSRISLAAFVQYSSTAARGTANLRFRYNPSEGHDLFVVWNEGVLTDRFATTPVPPLSERRTLMIKYSRTLTIGLGGG
ncbi:MAG: DUF5916 domain-containing protein [Gemmatimonadota bacterium]